MFKRHKLEKEEGKAYNDPGVRAVSIPLYYVLTVTVAGFGRDEGA